MLIDNKNKALYFNKADRDELKGFHSIHVNGCKVYILFSLEVKRGIHSKDSNKADELLIWGFNKNQRPSNLPNAINKILDTCKGDFSIMFEERGEYDV